MKKRLFTFILVLCVAVSAFGVAAGAVETASGKCGEDLTWVLEDGVLTISGTGAMDDFTEGAPWAAYKDEIRGLVLTGGVTTVGAGAFTNYDKLEAVDLGDALSGLGKGAFKSCDSLRLISLPKSFKVLGEESLQDCSGLEAIYCAGNCPSFKMNCLWNTYVTIYYPAEKPWSASTIDSLTTAFKGRVTFLPSDGSEPVSTEPEETTIPTDPEETTVPSEPEETTIPTGPEETTVSTEPEETTVSTEPEETTVSTEPEETTAPTTPGQGDAGQDGGMQIWKWILVALIVLLVIIGLAALLLWPRKPKYKGKYARRRRKPNF